MFQAATVTIDNVYTVTKDAVRGALCSSKILGNAFKNFIFLTWEKDELLNRNFSGTGKQGKKAINRKKMAAFMGELMPMFRVWL